MHRQEAVHFSLQLTDLQKNIYSINYIKVRYKRKMEG